MDLKWGRRDPIRFIKKHLLFKHIVFPQNWNPILILFSLFNHMFLFPWFLRYRHLTTIPNPFLLVLKQLFTCPVLKISEAQFEVGQWDTENPYEIPSWLCFVFIGTRVHVMSSKTIIVTLEGNKGRKADHQVGMEKPDLQIFAQRYCWKTLEEHKQGELLCPFLAVPYKCTAKVSWLVVLGMIYGHVLNV